MPFFLFAGHRLPLDDDLQVSACAVDVPNSKPASKSCGIVYILWHPRPAASAVRDGLEHARFQNKYIQSSNR
jgi:hypothetical protein